jgi:CPA2 family monovalent cation:H+ antiporter-2
VTVNDRRSAERMVSAARHIQPDAVIFARAADSPHAARLLALGAAHVVPVTVEASLQLAARLLESLDLPEETVSKRITDMRAAEFAKLRQSEQGA